MLVRDGELSILLASAKVGTSACEKGRVEDLWRLDPEAGAWLYGSSRAGPRVVRVLGFERANPLGVGGVGFSAGVRRKGYVRGVGMYRWGVGCMATGGGISRQAARRWCRRSSRRGGCGRIVVVTSVKVDGAERIVVAVVVALLLEVV